MMNACFGRSWLGVIAAVFLAGCSARSGLDQGPPTAEANTTAQRPPADPAPIPAPPAPEPSGESIYRIKKPGTQVALGTRVVLDGPSVLVTATSATKVWVQEAGDDGGCEIGDGVVAYRAIVVHPLAAPARLAPGQRVRVEGVVTETEGHRVIAQAVLQAIGTPAYRYEPHCERDGDSLALDALDGVLVITAGTTAGLAAPDPGGAWSLSTCFGAAGPRVGIGAEMATHETWAEGWHWVTGVMTRSASGARLLPRNEGDISSGHGDDACL